MNSNLFLEPSRPKRRFGLFVALLILTSVAVGGIWYLATLLNTVKSATTKRPTLAISRNRSPKLMPAPVSQVPPPVAMTAAVPISAAAKVAKPKSLKAAPLAPTQPVPPPVTPLVPAATTSAMPVADATKTLAEARELFKNDRCLQACDLCTQLLENNSKATVRAEAEDLLGAIHTQLVFSRRPMPEKTDYTVQPGDTLAGLAKKFNTTMELLRRSNNFTGDVIRVGDRFRVLDAKWSVEISKNRNDLLVRMNGKFFKRYRVGTGQYSMTPTGTFHVVSRLEHPTWYRAGVAPIPYGNTNNVLGTHWISLDIPHYGIHGTWETNTIGRQSSQGCIRLLNSEVEELYTLLPEGTPITISE